MRSLLGALADLWGRFMATITGREGRGRQFAIAALGALCIFAMVATGLLIGAQSESPAAANLARSPVRY